MQIAKWVKSWERAASGEQGSSRGRHGGGSSHGGGGPLGMHSRSSGVDTRPVEKVVLIAGPPGEAVGIEAWNYGLQLSAFFEICVFIPGYAAEGVRVCVLLYGCSVLPACARPVDPCLQPPVHRPWQDDARACRRDSLRLPPIRDQRVGRPLSGNADSACERCGADAQRSEQRQAQLCHHR